MTKRLDPTKRTNLIPKGEKGKCRWCSKPVPKGRRSWCSQECVDDALIRAQPSYARRKVEDRDKGVCAECNRDTRQIENTLRRLGAISYRGIDAYDRTMKKASARYRIEINRMYDVIEAGMTSIEYAKEGPQAGYRAARPPLEVTPSEQRIRLVSNRLKRLASARLKRLTAELSREGFDGISWNGRLNRSLWDADHIIPVVKGGGGCGLENYRTLCQPCHKRATAALAAERAAKRRANQHPELKLNP